MTTARSSGSSRFMGLGFGCSGLMARLDRRQSMQLLDAALDAGITHFDTARSYGYGAAESVLGEFIAARRDQVTVTTKVGILPPERSFKLNVAMPIARRIATIFPGLRQAMRRRATGMVQASVFDVAIMQRSLETSLRELKTDHVDFLLLHDCGVPDLNRDEVREFLERARSRGQVVRYGIGTDVDTVRAAIEARATMAGVVQFASSAFENNVDQIAVPVETTVITHSALGQQFGRLRTRLSCDPAMARVWGDALGINPLDGGELGALFVAAALAANPNGMVLFSSTNRARIQRNARALHSLSEQRAQIAALQLLAANWTLQPQPTSNSREVAGAS